MPRSICNDPVACEGQQLCTRPAVQFDQQGGVEQAQAEDFSCAGSPQQDPICVPRPYIHGDVGYRAQQGAVGNILESIVLKNGFS